MAGNASTRGHSWFRRFAKHTAATLGMPAAFLSALCLLQSTRMRDSTAIHLKLDELLRSVSDARNSLVSLEKLPDDRLQSLHDEFTKIANAADRGGSSREPIGEHA